MASVRHRLKNISEREAVTDLSHLFRNAMPVPDFEKAGNVWEPDFHFTGTQEDIRQQCIEKVPDPGEVIAYWFYSPLPGGFSLELQVRR